jgi:hypothetical protein
MSSRVFLDYSTDLCLNRDGAPVDARSRGSKGPHALVIYSDAGALLRFPALLRSILVLFFFVFPGDMPTDQTAADTPAKRRA